MDRRSRIEIIPVIIAFNHVTLTVAIGEAMRSLQTQVVETNFPDYLVRNFCVVGSIMLEWTIAMPDTEEPSFRLSLHTYGEIRDPIVGLSLQLDAKGWSTLSFGSLKDLSDLDYAEKFFLKLRSCDEQGTRFVSPEKARLVMHELLTSWNSFYQSF